MSSISLADAERAGRVEISDPALVLSLDLTLSKHAVDEIRELEECLMMAEQRLGAFRVD